MEKMLPNRVVGQLLFCCMASNTNSGNAIFFTLFCDIFHLFSLSLCYGTEEESFVGNEWRYG